MTITFQNFGSQMANALDYLLGWLLYLPRDLTVLMLAVGTTALMTLARKWLTNQDLLGRCQADLKRLGELIQTARRAGERDTVQRLRTTQTMLRATRLRADFKVLGVVLLPLAALSIWAAERLDYFPVRTGDQLQIVARFSPSSAEKLVFLVPIAGVELKSNAIQQIAVDEKSPGSPAVAAWTVVATTPAKSVEFVVRHQQQSVTHPILLHSIRYLPPLQSQTAIPFIETEVTLVRYRWLGFIPGLDAWGLAPWMVGYLVLALLLLPVTRRIFQTA